jgi:hypothetical protein
MNPLTRLNNWYQSQCDGNWEHGWGITLGTIDNPGWSIEVHLTESPLEYKPFVPISIDDDDDMDDWIFCKVEEGIFRGSCCPKRLDEMLEIFLDWADA